MFAKDLTQLPIFNVLDALQQALNDADEAVLEAPPGAGKTTVVPLALLQADWCAAGKIILLEPRRVAARAAAERMADLLGETVGETVGYRMRLDTRVGPGTRIEVVTEGVFTRMLQQDPALESVAIVIFDEFHERSLDADLGLALTLNGRELFSDLREQPLKLLVMSATLDGAAISELLGGAPQIRSEGKMFAVETRYGASYRYGERIEERVTQVVLQALADETGSVLVFLPGGGEIRRVAAQLTQQLRDAPATRVVPLYGELSLQQQRLAIAPAPAGQRKVVLATNIAETSLTIDGVRVVVDSGLCRTPEFDPRTGMTRLATRRIARSSAVQRAGRAGRLEPGVCYRLWSDTQQDELARYTTPEIQQADLLPLVLQMMQWGVKDPGELRWLDTPQASAWGQALELLQRLGAVVSGSNGPSITEHGEAMAQLPLHPRLSHMLIRARQWQCYDLALDLAVVLQERSAVLGQGIDIQERLDALNASGAKLANVDHGHKRLQRLRQQLARALGEAGAVNPVEQPLFSDQEAIGVLLACAYPDRLAAPRHAKGTSGADVTYQLSNGRAAQLQGNAAGLAGRWLAVADLSGIQGQSQDRIYLAAETEPDVLRRSLPELFQQQTELHWCEKTGRFVAEKREMLGAIVVSTEPLQAPNPEQRAEALLQLVRRTGLDLLQRTEEDRQWCARVELLRQLDLQRGDSSSWPDVTDGGLLQTLEQWLAPYLGSVTHLDDLKQLDFKQMLSGMLPWPMPAQLDEWLPSRIQVPSGNHIAVDYCQSPPVLAVKLQEMFGCVDTPCVAQGRQKLMLHLLSPARRPLQVTQDLAGFWCGAYDAVKKEMKGRYPKHPWPDDPMQALPTAKTKRHL